MNLTTACPRVAANFGFCVAVALLSANWQLAPLQAGDGTLDLPGPRTATNGALHYQRAILFLDTVDPAKRELLTQPFSAILRSMSDPGQLEAVNELLIESRHAIKSAIFGASQAHADFGIEPGHYVEATLLPHAHPMVDLSKLVLLHGMQLQSEGDWEGAAEVYLKVLKMGRHMTHQTTFAEALMGTEILEGGYFATALWAVHCPEPELVEQASVMLNVLSNEMVDPAVTLTFELRYVKMQLARMREAFPDGDWASMILVAVDADVPHANQEKMQQAAIAAAKSRGIPEDVFSSKQAFDGHLDKLRTAHLGMANAIASAMTLPMAAAVERGQEIYREFGPQLKELGDPQILNPGRIAAYFATHDAELALLKVILALSASKGDDGFPASLEELADRFGGQVPRNPYDDSPLVYEVTEGGQGFNLTVREVQAGEIELPRIEFKFAPSATSE